MRTYSNPDELSNNVFLAAAAVNAVTADDRSPQWPPMTKARGYLLFYRVLAGRGGFSGDEIQPDHQPERGCNGDRFITEDLKLTRRTQVMEDVLNQLNYGAAERAPRPSVRYRRISGFPVCGQTGVLTSERASNET